MEMEYRCVTPINDKATIGRGSADTGNGINGSLSGGKNCEFIIFPTNAEMDGEGVDRRNQNWIFRAKLASDLIVQVEDSSFHLHEVLMVSKSGYLNKLVFRSIRNREKDQILKIQVKNFPGGAKIFELVVRFCYGWKVDLTAQNVAPVLCAAHFLEMSDGFEQGNLISKAEAFLSYVLSSSWKGIFQILKSCENISSWAKELKILKRCSEVIAWNACLDPNTFTFSNYDAMSLGKDENWWFEDVSLLRIDHLVEVIESIKRKGVRSDLVGSCIACWTGKWLSQVPFRLDNLPKHLTDQLLRVTAESLIRVIPEQENSISCNFLLHLLKFGVIMRIHSELLNKLEKRIALMLEKCCVSDLLVKNHSKHDTAYDIKIVTRVVKKYVSLLLKNATARILVIGRLVDGYLMQVARDEKLSAVDFQLLAEALPKNARYCDDNLYRSIDMYLKTHPRLTKEETRSVCRAMDCHKLSHEARQHAKKNGRLPLDISMCFNLVEQVNMTRSMTITRSNYQRSRSQAIIRGSTGLGKGMTVSQKDIRTMKKEVEDMKLQLNALETCKMRLQKQVTKRCII